MIDYIIFAIIGGLLWGMMDIPQAHCAQFNFHGSLFIKCLVFGIAGLVLLAFTYNKTISGIKKLIKFETKAFILFIIFAFLGAIGTYCVFMSFQRCGKNKGISIIVATGVPVIVVVLGSHFFLKEKINIFAIIGILMMVGGIILIRLKGSNPVKKIEGEKK